MIVVNLFAGPGSGKSTTAAGIFSILKLHEINCEYVPEFAKDLTWENRFKTLENQIYIFAKQQHRLWRMIDQVDVVVTDAPLIQGLAYIEKKPSLTQLVMSQANEFNNLNFFLTRVKVYNPKGRFQTMEEAMELDTKIINTLMSNKIVFKDVHGDKNAINEIAQVVLNKLEIDMKFKVIEYQEV